MKKHVNKYRLIAYIKFITILYIILYKENVSKVLGQNYVKKSLEKLKSFKKSELLISLSLKILDIKTIYKK